MSLVSEIAPVLEEALEKFMNELQKEEEKSKTDKEPEAEVSTDKKPKSNEVDDAANKNKPKSVKKITTADDADSKSDRTSKKPKVLKAAKKKNDE